MASVPFLRFLDKNVHLLSFLPIKKSVRSRARSPPKVRFPMAEYLVADLSSKPTHRNSIIGCISAAENACAPKGADFPLYILQEIVVLILGEDCNWLS